MNSQLILPLILQALGLGVVVAEIMLPSGGLLSLAAAGLFGYSLYYVFANVSAGAGMAFIVADIIILPIVGIIGLKMLARSPMALRSSLSRKSGVVSYDEKLSEYLGKEGVALTDLRPSGTIRINGNRIDVVSRGDYIDKGEAVIVIKVEGSRVVVKKKIRE